MSESSALERAFERAAARAAERGRPHVVALRREAERAAPHDLFRSAHDADRFFWRIPARRVALCATGCALAIESSGPLRFAEAASRAAALWAEAELLGAGGAPPEAGPLLVGGFGFDAEAPHGPRWRGFPALRFWLPERLITSVGGRRWQTLCGVVQPGESATQALRRFERSQALPPAILADPQDADAVPGFQAAGDAPAQAYLAAVACAVRAIRDGELEKVVLARACTLTRTGGFDAARFLRTLEQAHPSCFVYGVGIGDAVFAGASPERLLSRAGFCVQADALAGSAPRGRTPQEDAQLGRALRESKKEQAEHAAVRRALLETLSGLGDGLHAPESPSLLRLEGIQHLHTPVSVRARRGTPHILELAGRLHPTPAVGGAPRDAALAFLARHERTPRGWYAGGVGWIAPSGDGEIALALRGALLRGEEALLHAGAGVVAGSTPEAELAETRLKLRAAFTALVEL